jgi:stringent starvation protein B
LLRALYEWLVDNDDVTYVLVDATCAGVMVPSEHVKDGQIVLNIGPEAVRDLHMEQDYVMCSSRFGGRAFELYLPMAGILAVYGRDTRQGMVFPDEEFPSEEKADETAAEGGDDGLDDKGDKPTLRLV